MNKNSLFASMTLLCLGLTLLGLIRLGVDLWTYFGADQVNAVLNKRGLGGAAAGAVMSILFFGLYRLTARKPPVRRSQGPQA